MIIARVGLFFMEADLGTEFGMSAYQALELVRGEGGDALRADGLAAAAAREGLPRESIRFESVSFAYPGAERAGARRARPRDPGRRLARDRRPERRRQDDARSSCSRGSTSRRPGRITVDGIDVRDARRSRAGGGRIAAIFQDFVHYELPVADNVGFGAVAHLGDEPAIAPRGAAGRRARGDRRRCPTASRRRSRRAYTGGVDVSGGQWQRIALARALFALEQGDVGARARRADREPRRPRRGRALRPLHRDHAAALTTILISHRFSTVRRADRIVVLDDGAIVEQGTPRRARRARRPLRGAVPAAGRALHARRATEATSEALARRSSATSSASRCASTGGGRTSLVGLVLVTAVSVPLFALGTKAFVNAAAAGNATRAMVFGALVGVLWIASVAIGHLVRPVAFELGDLNGLAFDAELIALGGGSAGLEHLENPEYANRLERARSDGGDLFLGMLFLASLAGSCSSCS